LIFVRTTQKNIKNTDGYAVIFRRNFELLCIGAHAIAGDAVDFQRYTVDVQRFLGSSLEGMPN
jgi:hypothetical protein